MKIGVLILAHSNIVQLKRLVNSLKDSFSIFIHIDKKSDIAPEEFEGYENVEVIKNHKIYWAHYSMISATVDLLSIAYAHNCDYYMLISGSDFPVKSSKEIIGEIEKNSSLNYVSYEKLPRPDWSQNGGYDRLKLFYCDKVKNPKTLSFGNKIWGLTRKLQKGLNLYRKLYPIEYYGGSQWMNLSREMVEYILGFVNENPDYLRSFRCTRVSDEIWIHTIIANSPYTNYVVKNNKRYIIWQPEQKNPKVLDITDYDEIIASDAFFARKFDSTVDNEVIDKIYALIADK